MLTRITINLNIGRNLADSILRINSFFIANEFYTHACFMLPCLLFERTQPKALRYRFSEVFYV